MSSGRLIRDGERGVGQEITLNGPVVRMVERIVRAIRRWIVISFLAIAACLFLLPIDLVSAGSGFIEHHQVVDVRAQRSGRIVAVYADGGEVVEAGDSLFSLDSEMLLLEGSLADADLRDAGLSLDGVRLSIPQEISRQEFEVARAEAIAVAHRARLRSVLTDHNVVADVDSVLATYSEGQHVALDIAVADLRAALAAISAARASLVALRADSLRISRGLSAVDAARARRRLVESSLRRSLVVAPVDGVILSDGLRHAVGRVVAEGEAIAQIGESGKWSVTAFFKERDIAEIPLGARVRIDVLPNRGGANLRLDGHVRYVGFQPADRTTAQYRVAEAGVFRVEVDVDRVADSLDWLRNGLSVRANVVTESGRIGAIIARRVRRYVARPALSLDAADKAG